MSNDPLDGVQVLDPDPQLDDALILRLQYDVAAKIHTYDEVATRYGLTNSAALWRYLKQHPGVVKGIKKLRATIESEEGAETRVRLKALLATEELIGPTAGIAIDPKHTAQSRIDAFKQVSRIAGVDGLSAALKAQQLSGNQFTLNILFRDGQRDLTVSTSPDAPVSLPKTVLPDDSSEYDEDV
jgi:hypothetical protein